MAYTGVGLTFARLQVVDNIDKHGIIELLDFVAGIGPATRLPEVCMSKKVRKEWLVRRIASVGRLTPERITKLVGASGKLDWGRAGVFSFIGGGASLQVTYCEGNAVYTPEGFAFNSKCILQDNHADALAIVVVGSLTPPFVSSRASEDWARTQRCCSTGNHP